MTRNDLFLRACRKSPVERTPVWMMRQAGRYLPEYRAVRSKVDFLTMCKTPELAAEVTIQPVDILGVDAAIIFSDILVVPEAMGMQLEMIESRGPRFPAPIRTSDGVAALKIPDPERELKYVLEAIRCTKRALGGRVPLIGFAGSPWTLAAYMVDGGGTKDFRYAKAMMLDAPELMRAFLEKLSRAVSLYLEAQLAAGADAVQIFDSWGGVLAPDLYKMYSLEYLFKVVSSVRRNGAPIILFSKGANHALREIADTGADVVSIDWTADLGEARAAVGEKVALQGNLDPSVLYASPEAIRKQVRSILRKYGKGSGHIFNLGHGISPDVEVEHAKALVRAVQEESPIYHQGPGA
jgi:uroporphyrinogen decarboxylase